MEYQGQGVDYQGQEVDYQGREVEYRRMRRSNQSVADSSTIVATPLLKRKLSDQCGTTKQVNENASVTDENHQRRYVDPNIWKTVSEIVLNYVRNSNRYLQNARYVNYRLPPADRMLGLPESDWPSQQSPADCLLQTTIDNKLFAVFDKHWRRGERQPHGNDRASRDRKSCPIADGKPQFTIDRLRRRQRETLFAELRHHQSKLRSQTRRRGYHTMTPLPVETSGIKIALNGSIGLEVTPPEENSSPSISSNTGLLVAPQSSGPTNPESLQGTIV
ncbi:unnamed protein product [Nesidiocoris tenuis]|uniref:Uncharacterized protein n=1 Tax=Nesidiocoris tenuis TaxID=355587 RepID=A0A6H5G8B8_9HEMI|nr:unnamed protein product [Nesidiocoris tenuis]